MQRLASYLKFRKLVRDAQRRCSTAPIRVAGVVGEKAQLESVFRHNLHVRGLKPREVDLLLQLGEELQKKSQPGGSVGLEELLHRLDHLPETELSHLQRSLAEEWLILQRLIANLGRVAEESPAKAAWMVPYAKPLTEFSKMMSLASIELSRLRIQKS